MSFPGRSGATPRSLMPAHHLARTLLETARELGDRTALRGKAEGPSYGPALTWAQLATRARTLGQSLAASGVPEGNRVAIFSGNCIEWVLCDYGAFFAGAVVVPLYPSSTPEQASFILEETESRVVFAGSQETFDKALQARKPERPFLLVALHPTTNLRGATGAMHLMEFEALGSGAPWAEEISARLSRATSEDLFTILYTSGTTGEPKGVMLTHGNMIAQFAPHQTRLPPTGTGDVSLCFLPLSHIFERGWTHFALSQGMEVHIVEEPTRVMEALARSRPAVMCTVPRLLEKIHAGIQKKRGGASKRRQRLFDWSLEIGGQVAENLRAGRPVAPTLRVRRPVADRLALKKIRGLFGGRLRFLPCAGAPLARELHQFFWAAGVPVLQGYGLTETCATVCAHSTVGFSYGSVGPPLPGTEVRISPEGEILVKGPGVMKGYFKREQETREALAEGWFHTGDQGVLDGKGALTITDRLKDLIKTSGGKMVAPQALELGVSQDPLVDQVAVVGDLRHYITALIVPAFDALSDYAKSRNISYHSFEELVAKPEIVALFEEKVAAFNQTLARFEQIRKFRLLPAPFTVEGGEITPTLKVRRKKILEKYAGLLDAMYAEPTEG